MYTGYHASDSRIFKSHLQLNDLNKQAKLSANPMTDGYQFTELVIKQLYFAYRMARIIFHNGCCRFQRASDHPHRLQRKMKQAVQ